MTLTSCAAWSPHSSAPDLDDDSAPPCGAQGPHPGPRQAACWYSLISPPRTCVRRSMPVGLKNSSPDVQHRLIRRAGAQRTLLRCLPDAGFDHQDRQHPRPPTARRGRLAPPCRPPARPCASGGNWPRRQPGPAATWVTGDYTPAGSTSTCDTNARSSPTSPSPANSPAGAGRWPSWTDPPRSRFVPAVLAAARGATRDTAISSQSPSWRRSTLDTRPAPAEQPVLR